MTGALARIAVVAILGGAPQAWAAEPLLGTWRLLSQEVAGQPTDPDPLTLRILPSGNSLEFAYSLPVNNIQFVSMRFITRLDGTEGEVKNAQGNKIGTVRISKANASEYTVTLTGQNRPTASSKMKVSADGKKLTCESDSKTPQQENVHTVQVFLRR